MPSIHLKHTLTLASLAWTLMAVPSVAAAATDTADTIGNARDATAAYTQQAAALAGGYELLTDSAGIACISEPGMGAMGVHFVKGALVGDGALDPARPEALVYEVTDDSQLRLAALEYVVIQAAWDGAHNAPPTMFGQQFNLTPAGNRYGLPAFYSLHAWLWKSNPSGMFAPMNPNVHCDIPIPAQAAQGTPGAIETPMEMMHALD
jgi:hypothetical protein